MAADIKSKYAASAASITITLNSLASGSVRGSTVVDNTSNVYIDALVQVTCKLTTGTIGSDRKIYIYAYATVDGASPIYPSESSSGNPSGSDEALTLQSPTNLRLIGVLQTEAQSNTYRSNPISVAAAFGGTLPPKWAIAVKNASGIAFDSSGCSAAYVGILAQSV